MKGLIARQCKATSKMSTQALQPTALLDYAINLDVVRSLHPKDAMGSSDKHYFSVGRSALVHVASALSCRLAYAGGETPVANVLDLACAAEWNRKPA